jgi:microcystin-dependent protein
MNNDGDFFIGNKIINPSTGEETTFNAPIPTVRGEDPSVLSVIFDEVVINDRLTVEGGPSKTILSSFGGPVSIDNTLNVSNNTTIDGNVEIAQNLNVSGNQNNDGDLNVVGVSTFVNQINANSGVDAGEISIGVGSSTGLIKSETGDLTLESATTIVRVNDNLDVVGTLNATFLNVPNVPPIGAIVAWSGQSTNIPNNWKICDGSLVSKTTYSTLYEVLTADETITNPFGADVGADFRLPNLTDRFVVTGGNLYNLGGTGGSKDAVAITHNHTINSVAAPDHTHGLSTHNGHGHNTGSQPNHSHNATTSGKHAHNTGGTPNHAHNTNNTGAHRHNTNATGSPHRHTANTDGRNASGGFNPGTHTNQNARGVFAEGGRQGTHEGSDARRGLRVNMSYNHSHGLTTNYNAGSHSHNNNYNGNHTHNTNNTGGHSHNVSNHDGHTHPTNAAGGHSHNVETGGSHSHNSNSEGGHNHGITPEASGVNGANRNLPPYIGLFYIIRVL